MHSIISNFYVQINTYISFAYISCNNHEIKKNFIVKEFNI